MNKTKVFIDPSIRIQYSSFYIKGLYDVFGKENVNFSKKYFKELKRKTESHSYEHYMAFVIVKKNELKKYIIDFRDKRSVKESAYNWCNKYAKINFSDTLTDKSFHKKMVSIPPGFGIKVWEKHETIFYCISNLLKCNSSLLVSLKTHLLDYYSQFKILQINEYTSNVENYKNNKYVFMIATLWHHENCKEETNLYRKKFVETCKSMNLDFEGGFFASLSHPQYKEFESLIFSERYLIKDYIYKTKKSVIVFNTPAVHDCHGWKLGEYLAMGKAIISSPLSNVLPEKMVHGKNIHFIKTLSELKDAVSLLVSNNEYRQKLEIGAKTYYDKYASPKAVIENLTNIKAHI